MEDEDAGHRGVVEVPVGHGPEALHLERPEVEEWEVVDHPPAERQRSDCDQQQRQRGEDEPDEGGVHVKRTRESRDPGLVHGVRLLLIGRIRNGP